MILFPAFSSFADTKIKLPDLIKEKELIFTDEEKCFQFEIGCPEVNILKEIEKMSIEHGVDTKIAVDIARCESQFNIRAKNPKSSAKGVYQFIDGTWNWIKAVGHQFDYKENIKQFMIWYPVHPEWWQECLDKI
jgi:hypothetical protein